MILLYFSRAVNRDSDGSSFFRDNNGAISKPYIPPIF